MESSKLKALIWSPRWQVVWWVLVILVITSWPGSAVASTPVFPHADKGLHAAMYGVLGWLVGRAWNQVPWRRFAWSVLAIGAFAAVDEWHQQFVVRRSADRYDWLADVVGAVGGMSLVRARQRQEHVA